MSYELDSILKKLSSTPDQPVLVNKFIELTLDLEVPSEDKVSRVISMLNICAQARAQAWVAATSELT
jgi:hypothetical protein